MDNTPKILNKKEWPKRLFEIPEPPKKLWIRGKLPDQERIPICIVGSRKHSSYGKEACEHIIESLKNYPVIIVSGLAYGIDYVAHSKAIEVGLPCIAVPGSGLSDKVLYPKAHQCITQTILSEGGCLLSEFPPDFKATKWSFPKRNRIMAGLSVLTIIIEASMKSGTMITARLATDYNRDVATIPHSIFSYGGEGPHYLMKNGATPIRSVEDILELLNIHPITSAQEINLPKHEKEILNILQEPLRREDIFQKIKIDPQTLSEKLTLLELKGFLKEESGYIYRML